MSTTWQLVTYGIPLLSIFICIFGGLFLYRLTLRNKIEPDTSILLYLASTSSPFFLAVLLIQLGGYLGNEHGNYVLYGEATWGLYAFTWCYPFFAVICNIVFAKKMHDCKVK